MNAIYKCATNETITYYTPNHAARFFMFIHETITHQIKPIAFHHEASLATAAETASWY